MKIGVDIDDVLTEHDQYYLDCGYKFIYDNSLPPPVDPDGIELKKFDWDEDTRNRFRALYYADYYDNAPVRRFAVEVLSKLRAEGHEIIILTGRRLGTHKTPEGELQRKRTRAWLDKNGVPYDRLVFADLPKRREITELGIELMIDDNPVNISRICDLTRVFCLDTRHNRNIECENTTRVYSWYDIYMKIHDLLKGSDGKEKA